MAKKKTGKKGYIVKWRSATRWYVNVLHNNKNISDSNSYKTAGGRNKKVVRLKELYPNHVVITKSELKSLQKK